MNEQIQNLEKTALLFALKYRENLNGNFTDYETEIIFREKFAELIVQECFSICEDLGDKGLDGHYCADKIKRTFGVE